MKPLVLSVAFVSAIASLKAQEIETDKDKRSALDSLYIHEVEDRKEPVKVLHAEPLYIDLIRDLGARKGEKEWNIGFGLTDNQNFDKYEALVEYEFAPINRLGLEVELPFSFYYHTNGEASKDSIPRSKLNSLKLAAQYSFFVSEKWKTSMAIGYLHEFEITDFSSYGKENLFIGNAYNPFFIAAKRFGNNFHTLIYAGPLIEHHFHDKSFHTHAQINTNFHYMITGTRNFIGVEFNKEVYKDDFDMIIRPQMRIALAHNVLVGIVTGIPIKRENERFSAFVRLIYEPGEKHK